MGDDPRPGDVISSTVSYESGVAATIDFRRPGASARPGGRGDAPGELDGLPGRILGDFVLGDVLGRGGCGTVYRAEQRTLDRPAVVKVLHRSPATRRDLAERFVREARLASRFDHPYAAHVYAFGVEPDGIMWIAMELVDGTPLGRLVKQSGPLALDQFVPLFERLCEVVQSAHDQGIVHRDIKPSNVMVIARAGRLMPKLLDFGIAKLVPAAGDAADATGSLGQVALEDEPAMAAEDAGATLTLAGQVLGSPAYMAPEQWRDATTAGPLADQYALALLGYEMLTGGHAFPGPTIEALAEQHRAAPLPALPAHLPTALDGVLARATDKLPERRFANLTELANAIRIAARAAELDEPAATLPDDVVPYPGLAPYTAADRALFVGRERDVEDVLDRLDAQPIVTVVGPSGSGKTSFLAAGLAPALRAGWRAELGRPGSDPLGVLAAIAARGDAPPDRDGGSTAAMSPTAIAAALVGMAEAKACVVVVIIDQAEELFTMCTDEARRAGFADALALASASSQIRVVLALRDDFLCRVEQLPAWHGRLGRAVHVLGVPGRDDLERMLTVPARRRGFAFDDPALPRKIVDEVADRPGALPLVAFTAARLWEHRDRRLRRMTRAAYERIGGVTGALVQHADSVVDRMPVPDRRQVRLVFRRLITAEGARALIGRAELESALGAGSAAVVDRLLAARLVVSRDDDAGDRVEIIHETLATTWPRLAAWRAQDADGARLAEQLSVAARHWNERGRPADLTWRGDALADLRRWQDRGDHSMTPVERAFAQASVSAAARARRVRIAVVAAAFTVLVAGIVGLVSANRKIARQRADAVERLSSSFEERGRAALADGDHARAMLFLAEASRLGADGPGLALLTSRAAVSLDAGLEVLGHGPGIWELAVGGGAVIALTSDYAMSRWSPDGRRTHLADGVYHAAVVGELAIAVGTHGDITAVDRGGQLVWRAERAIADLPLRSGITGSVAAQLVLAFGKTATLRDARTGRPRGELPHGSDVTAVALDAAGALAATGDAVGVVRVWRTATGALVAACPPHTGIVRAIKFGPDARTVVSGGNDGEVRICDAATGAAVHRLIGHSHQVVTVDISADGRAVVSAGRDGKPRLWDAGTGLLSRVLDGHRGTVIHARFSPDDRRILTIGVDGTARLWDRDGAALGSLQGHGGPVFGAHWDVDGHLLTSSIDGALRRWDPERAIRTTLVRAHTGPIVDLDVSRDDRRVLTASADGTAAVWERGSQQPVARLVHGAKLRSAMFGPDGATALTVDDAGAARIWQLAAGTVIDPTGEDPRPVGTAVGVPTPRDTASPIATLAPGTTAATYAPGGGVITAGDGQVRFWTAAGAALGAVALDYAADRLVLDPGGRWLFVRGQASSVLVIDVAARAPAARLAIGDRRVRAIAANGERVAIADDAAIRQWRLGSWAPLDTLAGHKAYVTGLWFASAGRMVSASGDATLVWDADARLAGKLADNNQVFALAPSPDGTLFATTGTDGEIRIWDAASEHLLLQLPAHRLPAFTLALSHDGTTAITGGDDGRLVTWDLSRRARSTAELAEIVRCRVPLRLEGDVALPRELDYDDPACRSLAIDR